MSQDDFDIFGNINSFLENGPSNSESDSNSTSMAGVTSDLSINASIMSVDLDDVEPLDNTPKVDVTAGKGQSTAFKRYQKLKEKLETEMNSSKSVSPVTQLLSAKLKRKSDSRSSRLTLRQKRRPNFDAQDSDDDNNDSDDDDDDDDDYNVEYMPNNVRQNISFDDDLENYEMSIKIRWWNKVERHTLRKHQPFSVLIERLAANEKVQKQFLILNLDEKIIIDTDTPASIGYTLGKFISVRIVKDDNELKMIKHTGTNVEKGIELKIQMSDRRKPFIKTIEKSCTFKNLLAECAEELGCSVTVLKLSFDGEQINSNETPNDLDLEGGEMLELKRV